MFWNSTLLVELFTIWKAWKWFVVLESFFWLGIFFFVWFPIYLIKRLFRKVKSVVPLVLRDKKYSEEIDIDLLKERAVNRAYERLYYDESKEDQV